MRIIYLHYFIRNFLDVYAARTSHITQMAAIAGSKSFSVYVNPQCKISAEASKITDLTQGAMSQMLLHERPVPSMEIRDVLNGFLKFLAAFDCVVLVSHNRVLYDAPILMQAANNAGLWDDLKEKIGGFLTQSSYLKQHTLILHPTDKRTLLRSC